MDTARYWIALILVAGSPGMFLYWFSIHPFIRFWRRLGPRRTLAVHYAGIVLLAVPVVFFRDRLLAVEFGTRPALVALGIVLYGVAVVLRVLINRQLSSRTLTGLPELAPEESPGALLTEGVYARVRHPRYAQILVVLLAFALFANYLAVWAVFLLAIPWVNVLARVEEMELRARFGEAYELYAERVPRRFLPYPTIRRRASSNPPGSISSSS